MALFGQPKREVFWSSKEELVPGVPVMRFFEFEKRIYSSQISISEVMPGSKPIERIFEVLVRQAKGKQQKSLVELPSQNHRLGLPMSAVSVWAKDGHSSAMNFYIEQKGFVPATREDVLEVLQQTEDNKAAEIKRQESKDPVKTEKTKAVIMATAMAGALKDAVKEAVMAAMASAKPAKEART